MRCVSFVLSLGLVLAAGCQVSLDYSGTGFLCTLSTDCPGDQECIDGRCQVPGTGPDAGALDAGIGAAALVGNVVTLTFDEPPGRSNSTDRSGGRRDGKAVSAPSTNGRFGSARTFDPLDNSHIDVPGYAELFGEALTIEMWIRRDLTAVAETLLSNEGVESGTPTLHLAIDAGGQLLLRGGCDGSVSTATTTGAAIASGAFVHIAAVLDGTTATIYVDGAPVASEPFARTACPAAGPLLTVGNNRAFDAGFTGIIDEVKLSDVAKTAAEVQASMAFDSTALVGVCGDGLIEGAEQCDGSDVCCEASTCRFASDGTDCEGGAGTCASGACDVPAVRTVTDLVVEYAFDEGTGAVVGDSGPGAPLDLTIADELLVTWSPSGLELSEPVEIASVAAATKLNDAVTAAGAMTVEAWVTPANLVQEGPARIVTVSTSTSTRNFTLGQDEAKYVSRVRTTQTNGNGTPAAIGPPDGLVALTHVVAVYRANRSELYVNGVLRSSLPVPGTLASWTATSRIAIGDEFGTSRRDWAGTFHHVAVYARAMTSLEVAGNFAAGVP